LDSKTVKEILQISRQTLYNYVQLGKIRVTEKENGNYDYNDEDVLRIANITVEKMCNSLLVSINSDIKSGKETNLKLAQLKANLILNLKEVETKLNSDKKKKDRPDIAKIIKQKEKK
jgi:predicted site-specific integrase-resolvase